MKNIPKNIPKELVKSSLGTASVGERSSSKGGNGTSSVNANASVLGGGSNGSDILAERSTRRISPVPVESESRASTAENLTDVSPSVAPPAELPISTTEKISSASQPQPSIKLSESSTISTRDVIINSTGLSTSKSASVRSLKREPIVPQEVPKTLYELERAWRGLKDRPDLFAQYLAQNIQKKSIVKKVFKEAISPELLSSVFISLRDYCAVPVILTILGGLSTVNHFSMTLALLAEDDLTCIHTIFQNVLDLGSKLDEPTRTTIMQLKLLYKM